MARRNFSQAMGVEMALFYLLHRDDKMDLVGSFSDFSFRLDENFELRPISSGRAKSRAES